MCKVCGKYVCECPEEAEVLSAIELEWLRLALGESAGAAGRWAAAAEAAAEAATARKAHWARLSGWLIELMEAAPVVA